MGSSAKIIIVRKLFYGRLLGLVILLGLLSIIVSGCGSDNDDNAATQGNRLTFVIKNNLYSDQPVQGTTVALYNTDNRTIAQTEISDANGVVDFGDIGRNRATFSLVYEDAEGDRYIDTSIEMLVAENIVYYLDDMGNTLANIDLTLSDIPANAGLTGVQPLEAFQDHSEGGELPGNISVREADLQDDGKLSMLALTFSDWSRSSLIGYGYLLDQTVVDGASYDISLARIPLNLGWTTNPVTSLDYLFITGVRDGLWYFLSSYSDAQAASSGVMPFANEFPVEYYWVSASIDSLAGTKLSSLVRHDTLPHSLILSFPDYSVDSFDYAAATRTFSWGITGSSPRDFVSLDLTNYSDTTGQGTEWRVLMAGDTSSWQVMDLPAPASTWIDTANVMSSGVDIAVSTCDIDIADGIDSLWLRFISSEQVVETNQYSYCGGRELAGVGIASAEHTAAAVKPSQDARVSPGRPGLPGNGLGHFLHR